MDTDAAPPTNCERAEWVHDRPEIWAVVAMHLGLVGAWRLMLVCRAARAGAKEFLATLPGSSCAGGVGNEGGSESDLQQLDLATLRWEAMPSPLLACTYRACCAVRGALVVFSGGASGNELFSSVEMLSKGEGPFKALSPLSRATSRMRLPSR
mmetsp:Transcript_38173/g.61105  ORF Transcript_38173/g.61105 Transcript_38173/m.61105 type:complete len:153 (+) Transcript_38173:50-508(+)